MALLPVTMVLGGHFAEGVWTINDLATSVDFQGDLICGPHDAGGVHVQMCSQCGLSFAGRACGPSHACVAATRNELARRIAEGKTT